MTTQRTDRELLEILADEEGYSDTQELLEDSVFDSIVPGICPTCLGIEQCEPDARANWCPHCETNTVRSCLDIACVI